MELNPQLIDDSIGSFKKVFNEDVLATFTTLARLCFAKIGCGSAKKIKSCGFSFLCSRLALSLSPI